MAHGYDAHALQIPDGRNADLAEMLAYGRVLRDFVQQQEALLPEITSAARHNQVVDFLNELANSYNEQLRLFHNADLQRRQQLLATILHSGLHDSR
jgi:type II secretory pathway predicted ATPase ExeA